jgi:CMP-N,N'-diacetyllegionaminic acid synthase
LNCQQKLRVDKKNVLGIITARGGSKGIPRKNIKLLLGRPLIYYTIEAGKSARLLDRLIVSTEDREIADIAMGYGVEVPFMRPPELALDDTPSLPVLQHAISYMEQVDFFYPEIIVLLEPTAPLRRAEHIDEGIKKILDTDADSVISVCPLKKNPYGIKIVEGDRAFNFIESDKIYTRRQDLPKLYRFNAALYISKHHVIMKENRILGDDVRAIFMAPEESVNIDLPMDFMLAEVLLRQREEHR